MRPISRLTGALPELFIMLTLSIGLIGMHHLISTGCLIGTSTHAGAHVTDAEPPAGDVGSVADSRADLWTSSDSGFEQPPANADQSEHLGAVCMAVLMLFSVIVPSTRAIIARRQPRTVRINPDSSQRSTDPPDLRVLSISRT
jgi:hypothetical protein